MARQIKPRQARLLKELPKAKTAAEAIRKAGYSEATARNPQLVLQTESFSALRQKYLPDDKILKTHAESLEATKVISANVSYGGDLADANGMTKDFIEVPDFPTRIKAVDIAYKLGGNYAPEKTVSLNIEAQANLTQEKIDEINQIALDETIE